MVSESRCQRGLFGIVLLLLHIAVIAIYGGTAWYTEYTDGLVSLAQPAATAESMMMTYMVQTQPANTSALPELVAINCGDYTDKQLCSDLFNNDFDSVFQDVHIMTFIGFGFLMTFLKKYGYSAVGLNLLVAAFSCEWSALLYSYFWPEEHAWRPAMMDLDTMINADFTACTVLISMGAVLGKTTPLQLLIMALIECVLAQVNQYIGLGLFQASDLGGSMMIHTFGAYFGLAITTVLCAKNKPNSKFEKPTVPGDLFSMFGTVFLWLCWPSFNGALGHGTARGRAILNTYLSLIGSTMVAFALSSLTNLGSKDEKKRGRLDMMHIQNATLAGGVAMGTASNLMVSPWASLMVGSLAGLISVLGFKYLMPALNRASIHDTCGVHNLHGMPGIFGGLVGVLFAGIASFQMFGYSLYTAFPAMAPPANTTLFAIMSNITHGEIAPGVGRPAYVQAGYQAAALGVTMAIALVGGYITGGILRIPVIWGGMVKDEECFSDDVNFVLPEGEVKCISVVPTPPYFENKRNTNGAEFTELSYVVPRLTQ